MTAARYDQLVLAVGGGGGIIQNSRELFVGPTCGVCLIPGGERTHAPIIIQFASGPDRRYDGLLAQLAERPRGPTCYLYSAEFLEALTDVQRDAFQWREAVAAKPTKSTKQFFELVGAHHIAAPVSLPGGSATILSCVACGRRETPRYYEHAELPQWLHVHLPNRVGYLQAAIVEKTPRPPYLFVKREFLPEPLPPAVAVVTQERGMIVAVNDMTFGSRRTPRAPTPRGFTAVFRSYLGIIGSGEAG